MSRTPELDPSSVAISFVDILFALAVGQVFVPVANWAQDPKAHSLPSSSWVTLLLALTVTITSWIGYHASANKARFQVHFFNVELVKLMLDISMVAVYFMVAAFAIRQNMKARPETLLIVLAFILYAAWDLASAFQKRPGSKYRRKWSELVADPRHPEVTEDWTPTDWRRIKVTFGALAVTCAVFLYTWLQSSLSLRESVAIDVVLIVILIAYRGLKEIFGPVTHGAPASVHKARDHPTGQAEDP